MKTFTSELFGCVDAELATDSNLTSRVIEHIGWSFREDAVALRIGVGTQPKKNVAGIMHVHVMVHHDEVFCEHHLPHSPKAMHDLVGLHRIGLFDAYEDKVVKDAFGG